MRVSEVEAHTPSKFGAYRTVCTVTKVSRGLSSAGCANHKTSQCTIDRSASQNPVVQTLLPPVSASTSATPVRGVDLVRADLKKQSFTCLTRSRFVAASIASASSSA
jgi:hypothetical protein